MTQKGLGIDPSSLPDQNDKDSWAAMKEKFQNIFSQKTQTEWAKIFDGTDACVGSFISYNILLISAVPILEMEDVMKHPHNVERGLLFKSPETGKYEDPAPAPRLSRTPGKAHSQSELTPGKVSKSVTLTILGEDTVEVLLRFGFTKEEIKSLIEKGVLSSAKASL
jgi:alpha-methylacyl-CoA racemase